MTRRPGRGPAALELDRFGTREMARGAVVIAVLLSRVAPAAARRARRRRRESWGEALSAGIADAFETLGPTFVKLGQLITSSPGIFPAPLVAACQRHLYSVRPVPSDSLRAVIEADLGARGAEELFAAFDDQPLSAASIAQVHACTLPDGRPAVVKVQRPEIAGRMLHDLRILYLLARVIDRLPAARGLNAPGIITDLHAVTMRELDFRQEAEVQQLFRANLHAFRDNAMVTTPEVFPRWCGPRVITMERLEGVPLDRYAADPDRAGDGEMVLRWVIKAWLEAALVHGPFHGDVHAGNIWVLSDGRVSFLDFGINGNLDPGWREMIVGLFRGTALGGDFAPFARAAMAVGAIPADAGSDEVVGAQLAVLAAPFISSGTADVSFAEVLRTAVGTFEQFGAVVPTELVLVMKQLLYFEGYTKALAPNHVIPQDLYLLRNILPGEVAEQARQLDVAMPP